MTLHVPSKLAVLQTSSAHPRIYCLALLATKRSPRQTGSSPEFEDVFAQYFKTAAHSKASEVNGHDEQEKNKEALM
jgi:hypothetical protein